MNTFKRKPLVVEEQPPADLLSGDRPACPKCLHEHDDAFEWRGRFEEGEHACDRCGYKFKWRREVSTTYHTSPPKGGESR